MVQHHHLETIGEKQRKEEKLIINDKPNVIANIAAIPATERRSGLLPMQRCPCEIHVHVASAVNIYVLNLQRGDGPGQTVFGNLCQSLRIYLPVVGLETA